MDNKTRQKLKQLLPLFVVKSIKKYQERKNRKPQMVYNIGWTPKSRYKVLLSYIPGYVYCEDLNNTIGTKEKECSCLVHALVANGCSVDITYVDNTDGIASDYDFVIGQGNAFRKARELNLMAKSVLYLTEKTPNFSTRKEQERVEYLYERHGIKTTLSRSGKYFNNSDFDNLDYCIMIGKQGNEILIPSSLTFIIHPSGLKNRKFKMLDRKMSVARTHFIWIGSMGAVHKGLDILFDVFKKHPELTLHVCGLQPQDRNLLKSIIPDNIVDHGYVKIDSDEFQDIASKCACIIYPSCSEGVATSVITAMNHGIIPLVSEESSFELGDAGETMTSFKVEDVEDVVVRWSQKANMELETQSQKTLEWAEREYSIDKYDETIHRIIGQILG